jgi:hypothetical protein
MLKLIGLVVLIVLILVGALLPLKYTARMHLPKPPPDPQAPAVRGRNGAGRDPHP